jgi:DNA-binding GntR family transcriptional regulator
VRVLSRLFRRLFLYGLRAVHAAGRLAFFGDLAPLADTPAFEAMLDAIEAGDADAAEALMKEHIGNGLAMYRERLHPMLQAAKNR